MHSLKNSKLLRLLQYLPIMVIVVFTIVLNLNVINSNERKITALLDAVHSEVLETKQQQAQAVVEQAYQQIEHEKALIDRIAREKLRLRVQTAFSIVDGLLKINKDKPLSEVKQLIIDTLRAMRFDDGTGYFYIYDMEGRNIMHPILPEMENTLMLDMVDSRGNYIIQNQLKSIKETGQAYNHYWYIKPSQQDREFEKVSFDRYLESLGWYIGSGAYVEDIEKQIQAQVLSMLSSVNLGNTGYIFVSDIDGSVKLQNQKIITDHPSLFLSNDNEKHQELIQIAKTGDFFTYEHTDVHSGDIEEKISYVRLIKDWNWVIGTGFYTSDITKLTEQKKQKLIVESHLELQIMLAFSVLLTILLTVIVLVIGKRVTNHVILLEEQVIGDYERLESSKNEMQYMAEFDLLTNLPNRTLLSTKIQKNIGLSRLEDKKVAVVFVDLDDFKNVNDQFGHSAGDQLLQQIGKRFELILGKNDFVARFGGDEFVFCLPLLKNSDEARHKVEQILGTFEKPFLLAGNQVQTSCSIGVSMYPDDGHSVEELISKADIVLYRVKDQEKGNVLFYDAEINQQVQHDFQLENHLRQALGSNEIGVVYQPQIDAETQQICAVEALCRWNSDDLGFISPLDFIPLAERTGLIHQVGEFVFETACRDTLALMPNGVNAIGVSINISPKQFSYPGFEDKVLSIVKRVGIDIERITLEITENIFIEDLHSISPILNRFRDHGFGISLDDFCTGYSSLNYLNNLPITEIKIDRSFVDKLLSNKQSDTLVKAIIAIGSSCHMKVVAEGVETIEQHQKLKEYHCDLLQGYYFDKPLMIDDLVDRYGEKKTLAS
ncbi:putative membrane associated regulator, GGDEF family protein [Aliivibrio wodanis]|uniref:Putative membrane associated regulator, GGDEF family protein n=1 Tax=Aliivibrio wodanis TaxID=80852 RepID=A0A090I770_9GAMM|nr:putative membrane associated regulator, GGDEF family protein [Aliivibrio wodanis]